MSFNRALPIVAQGGGYFGGWREVEAGAEKGQVPRRVIAVGLRRIALCHLGERQSSLCIQFELPFQICPTFSVTRNGPDGVRISRMRTVRRVPKVARIMSYSRYSARYTEPLLLPYQLRQLANHYGVLTTGADCTPTGGSAAGACSA